MNHGNKSGGCQWFFLFLVSMFLSTGTYNQPYVGGDHSINHLWKIYFELPGGDFSRYFMIFPLWTHDIQSSKILVHYIWDGWKYLSEFFSKQNPWTIDISHPLPRQFPKTTLPQHNMRTSFTTTAIASPINGLPVYTKELPPVMNIHIFQRWPTMTDLRKFRQPTPPQQSTLQFMYGVGLW